MVVALHYYSIYKSRIAAALEIQSSERQITLVTQSMSFDRHWSANYSLKKFPRCMTELTLDVEWSARLHTEHFSCEVMY